jgi:hypothetical protein
LKCDKTTLLTGTLDEIGAAIRQFEFEGIIA